MAYARKCADMTEEEKDAVFMDAEFPPPSSAPEAAPKPANQPEKAVRVNYPSYRRGKIGLVRCKNAATRELLRGEAPGAAPG